MVLHSALNVFGLIKIRQLFMKMIMKIWMAALCVAAMAVATSCGNNDDDNNYKVVTITAAEKAQQIAQLAGNYTGLAYADDDTTSVDPVAIEWNVAADSVLTVKNFPLSVMRYYLQKPANYDKTAREAYKAAINAMKTTYIAQLKANLTMAPSRLVMNNGFFDFAVNAAGARDLSALTSTFPIVVKDSLGTRQETAQITFRACTRYSVSGIPYYDLSGSYGKYQEGNLELHLKPATITISNDKTYNFVLGLNRPLDIVLRGKK